MGRRHRSPEHHPGRRRRPPRRRRLRRGRPQRRHVALALTLALAAPALALADDQSTAQRSVDAVLPGAQATITDDGSFLHIRLPGARPTDPLTSGGTQWRASLAALDARRHISLGVFEVRDAGGQLWFGQAFGEPRALGAVTQEEARQRAGENLEALRAQLPPGSIADAHAAIVPITEDPYFAVRFDVSVADADQLHGYADEFQTTLAAGLENAEGSAVEVHDPAGHELGVWRLPPLGETISYVDPAYSGTVTEKRAWRRPSNAALRPSSSARSVRIQYDTKPCDQFRFRVRRHRRNVTITVVASRPEDLSGLRCAPPGPLGRRVDLEGKLGHRTILDGSSDPATVRYRRPTA